MLIRMCCKLQCFDGYRDIRFGTWVNDVSFERWIEALTLSLVGFVFNCSRLLIVAIFGHEFFDFSRSWLLWLLFWFILGLISFILFTISPSFLFIWFIVGTLHAARIGLVQIQSSPNPVRSGLGWIPIGPVLGPHPTIFSVLGPAGPVQSDPVLDWGTSLTMTTFAS